MEILYYKIPPLTSNKSNDRGNDRGNGRSNDKNKAGITARIE
jgi:hypothetical protein